MRRNEGPPGGGEHVDPRVHRSRARIIEAATQQFLDQGYLDATLEDVAERAGVAKRTIYNRYSSKELLFREVLAQVVDTAEHFATEVAAALGEGEDVAEELRAAGVRLAQTVLGGRVVPVRRLLIGEVRRFPDLARDYYERAPGRVMAALADALRRYDARRALRIDDPELAAEHFSFLIMGAPLDRALFGAEQALDADEVARRAAAGVEVFLRAYQPPSA